MALNVLFCADMPLRNYSLTPQRFESKSEVTKVRGFFLEKSGNQKPWTFLAKLHRISQHQSVTVIQCWNGLIFRRQKTGKIRDMWQNLWQHLHILTNEKCILAAKTF